jgi:hypothetical protein
MIWYKVIITYESLHPSESVCICAFVYFYMQYVFLKVDKIKLFMFNVNTAENCQSNLSTKLDPLSSFTSLWSDMSDGQFALQPVCTVEL